MINKYQRILFAVSLSLCAVIYVIMFITAIRIYPAYAVFGYMNASQKYEAIRRAAIPALAAAACLALINISVRKLSLKSVIAAVIPALVTVSFSSYAAEFIDYRYSAVIFFTVPLAAMLIINDFADEFSCRPLLITSSVILAVIYAVMLFTVISSWLLMITYMYMILPCIIFTDAVIISGTKILSKYTVSVMLLTSAVCPLYNIFWSVRGLTVPMGIFMAAAIFASAVLYILDIRKISRRFS